MKKFTKKNFINWLKGFHPDSKYAGPSRLDGLYRFAKTCGDGATRRVLGVGSLPAWAERADSIMESRDGDSLTIGGFLSKFE